MNRTRTASLLHLATTIALLGVALSLPAADAVPTPPPSEASQANAPAPAPGAPGPQAGPGRGAGRGGPLTDEDKAAIARLADLPVWKRGAGDGDYSLAPPYEPAAENTERADVPKGKVVTFMMPLAGSRFYPPANLRGTVEAREVVVYIPAGYVPGTPAPLLVTHDAMGAHDREPAPKLPVLLDNMIAAKRLPPIVAVMLMHGGGDAPGSQRSLEYDTVSGKYAEFVEEEVLPRVTRETGVTFTKDPNARATLGGSSGGAAAFSMAWFHPELYRRVLVISGTFVGQQRNPETAPHGAWEFHENFIPQSPAKPLRVWLQVADRDNGATSGSAGFGNWVIANQRMAQALKDKGYHYQFVFTKEAGHVDRPVRAALLAPALEWLWQDYKPAGK
jgi:enterochelin esterase family protein